MAINVDTVYQRVLALANKEQRGYITPQEFNLFANQAQMEIFEQYFYDLNQFERAGPLDGETEYSNMVDLINDKIDVFKEVGSLGAGDTLPPDLYKLGDVHTTGTTPQIIQEVTRSEYYRLASSGLNIITAQAPVYVRSGNKIIVYPSVTPQITYIKKPNAGNNRVQWTYVVVGEKALYNASGGASHFELHEAEETELVYRILALSGITLNKPEVSQFGVAQQLATTQQEKQ